MKRKRVNNFSVFIVFILLILDLSACSAENKEKQEYLQWRRLSADFTTSMLSSYRNYLENFILPYTSSISKGEDIGPEIKKLSLQQAEEFAAMRDKILNFDKESKIFPQYIDGTEAALLFMIEIIDMEKNTYYTVSNSNFTKAIEIINQSELKIHAAYLSYLEFVGKYDKIFDYEGKPLYDGPYEPMQNESMNESSDNTNSSNFYDAGTGHSTQDTEEITYEKYYNTRFGFEMDFPSNFTLSEPSANGDGQKFLSPDQQSELIAWGGYNVLDENAEERYDQNISQISSRKGKIGYKTLHKEWFVISWIEDSKVIYYKQYIDSEIESGFEISYPESQRDYYDPIIARLSSSFKPAM